LIVTDEDNHPKLDGLANCPPVMMVDRGRSSPGDFAAALAAQSPVFDPVMLNGADPFVLLYTSGSTGSPKGVRWPLTGFLQNAIYMRGAVDLVRRDVRIYTPSGARCRWKLTATLCTGSGEAGGPVTCRPKLVAPMLVDVHRHVPSTGCVGEALNGRRRPHR
jgi:acyl-CoA synthetase (AMP-forming)/AMP-acid ligase II